MSSDDPHSFSEPAAVKGPPAQAAMARIMTYVTLPIMVMFMMLRIYTRWQAGRAVGVGIDDYLAILAAVSISAYCGLCLAYLDNPTGPHMWDVHPRPGHITVAFPRNMMLISILYSLATMFLKTSILSLYLRIFRPINTPRLLIQSAAVINVLFYLANVIGYAVGCVPRQHEAGWLSSTAQTRCIGMKAKLTVAGGIFAVATDVFVLGVPVVFVGGMTRLGWRKKVEILAVLMTGVLACAFSLGGVYYRMVQFYKMPNQPGDPAGLILLVVMMNVGEVNIGIVCSCMPVVLPLLRGLKRDQGPRSRSISWLSKLRDRIGRRHHNKGNLGSSFIDHGPESRAGDGQMGQLPQVPRGTLTGLRGFIKRAYREEGEGEGLKYLTISERSVMTADTGTCRSAEWDYHEDLRRQVNRETTRRARL